MFNFIVEAIFLSMIGALGISLPFWVYAIISVARWFFAYYLVTETKDLTLEQIENHWREGGSPRQMYKMRHGFKLTTICEP